MCSIWIAPWMMSLSFKLSEKRILGWQILSKLFSGQVPWTKCSKKRLSSAKRSSIPTKTSCHRSKASFANQFKTTKILSRIWKIKRSQIVSNSMRGQFRRKATMFPEEGQINMPRSSLALWNQKECQEISGAQKIRQLGLHSTMS